jgi:ATP-binding cassette subfamily B protein
MSILKGLLKLGQNGVSLAALVGLLFSLHWGVAAVLFGAALPGVLLKIGFSKKFFLWSRARTEAERRSAHFSWMLTSDMFAKEIRLFGLGPLFIESFRSLRGKLRRERISFSAKRGGMDLAGQAVATLAIFGAYAFIAREAIRGSITLGDMVMYFQAFQRGLGFLRDLLTSLAGLYEDSLFLTNFYEFLDLKKKVVEPAHPGIFPRPMREGIVFDGISFSYPGDRGAALENVNLRIRPGETVALVGENGSGKTTLIKLLCRLYDPATGRILVDGTDLREFETARLRREISVIFQDFAHYHLTAKENIWFGNIDIDPAKDGAARIAEAAARSGADEVIRKLKSGYDTILGKWFEDGEELSIGEWQKIALARAFLRDSQIIILDEPTSSLDAKAEYEVFTKFRDLVRGKSAVIISHRFSTVRMADTIHVLDKGRIIESGSHAELVSRGGIYARLYEMQARSYR